MPRPARPAPVAILARRATPLLVAALVADCGLSDVFSPAGVSVVAFRWESESLLRTGEAVPTRISVLIDGQPMAQPHLVVTVPDTTFIASNAAGDSLYARNVGRGDVVVELRSSLTTGEVADTTFEIRVQGGGGGNP